MFHQLDQLSKYYFCLYYFQNNLNLWDIAAGIILIKEAGGLINRIDLSINENLKVIASSTDINEKMLEKLNNF